MRDSDGSHTCLSDKPHGENVKDDVVHYFGCLRQSEREAFLEEVEEKTKQVIQQEERRIVHMRLKFERNPDSTAGKLLSKYTKTLSHWRRRQPKATPSPGLGVQRPGPNPLTGSVTEESGGSASTQDELPVDLETRAGMIFYVNSEPHDKEGCPDRFPDQKVSLKTLVFEKEESKNPLMQQCPKDTIRFFRLPANNMSWVEEAIARYYNEDRPDLGSYRRSNEPPHKRSKTQMLLRPEFWRGQQHGGIEDAVHARHMRPFCDIISTDPLHTEKSPKNLAIFMPYLHWESDRRRAKSAEIIKQQEKKQRLSSMAEVVDRKMTEDKTSTFIRAATDQGLEPVVTKGNKLLGKLLLLAAALVEAIDYDADEKLIRDFLYYRPPLHPRRTLDQSYYWTLKDTQKRDRDQVVYRGTAPTRELMHYKCFKDFEKNREEGNYGEDREDRKELVCRQCFDDVRKIPRVVMVDQLWMWILDENTIITCLPKRWGRNKPDPSGVYKSLRTRLKAARSGEVRSVYDLALIIIDQCSRVFFDRANPIDRQPQVIDIFANAIGKVTYKQSIAFENFWEYTRIASQRYSSSEMPSARILEKTLLDIHAEAKLLREIKDILDELHIMIHIQVQQYTVAKSLVKNIRTILIPHHWTRRDPTVIGSGLGLGLGMSPTIGPLPDLAPLSPDPWRKSEDAKKKEDDITWTLELGQDVLQGMHDRIEELKSLRNAADHTSAALKDLLALKQQQAGVVEAREAVKQAKETSNQGRSIMLFTVVTIVFLPLSFFTSVFGMNATELNGDPNAPSLNYIFSFMLPISSILIALSLLLAFSSFTRAILSITFKTAWTWAVTRSGLYIVWQDKSTSSEALLDKERKVISSMKNLAKVEDRVRKIEARERKEMEERMAREERNSSVTGRTRGLSNGDVELGRTRSRASRGSSAG